MKRKLLSISLALCMIISILPMTALAEDLPPGAWPDTMGHWAEDAIASWSLRGVLQGNGGLFRPDDPITRAELAVVLDRVMKYQEKSDASDFSDVDASAWYAPAMLKLNAAGVMLGSGGKLRPNDNINREEAAVMLGRAFVVPENSGNENPFPDSDEISDWASFLVDGMKAADYISGYPDGSFGPKNTTTRAEVVAMLGKIVDEFYNVSGTYGGTDNEKPDGIPYITNGNVVINQTDVTLKEMLIRGDLYITPGVGGGTVTLDNVTVTGTTCIWGGGPDSVIATDCDFNVIRLDALTNPALKLSQDTKATRVYLDDTGAITHGGATVAYDAETGKMTFGGNIDLLTLNADGTATANIGGIVYDIIPAQQQGAPKTIFEIASGAVVKNMVVNAPVDVTGTGKIEKMEIHSNGVVIDKDVDVKPENVTVDKDIVVKIGDKEYTGTGGSLTAETSTGGGTTTVSVTGVTLNKTALDLIIGGSETLVATVKPDNATNKAVTWTSSDDNIATVDSSGNVTAVAAGSATVMATAMNGKTAECAVTVSHVYSIGLDKSGTYAFPSGTLNKYGEQTPLNVTITNTGTDQVTNLTAALSGMNTDAFTLSAPGAATLAAGDDTVFAITPNTNLPEGTYTATVTVTGSNNTSAAFNVSFIVTLVDHYEFRSSSGGALVSADTTVPIGMSKDYQIYVVYYDDSNGPVNFATTPLDVTFSDAVAFPAAVNPGSLTGGNLLTLTATSDGGPNDALRGTTATGTVTDSAGMSGNTTLTLGHSLITSLTYYVETPGGIYDYASGAELKREYSASELTSARGGVLEIPRGLKANIWLVPVFTNTTMYDSTTANGDWKSYGVTTGYSVSGGVIMALQPGTSTKALEISGAGALMVDIGTAINTTLGINGSVTLNGFSHDLAVSAVSASLTVKIADPVLVKLDVEQWDGMDYVPIYGAQTGYTLSGDIGDELKLRVKAIYSDGSSIHAISNSNAYAGGVYFLPLDNLNTYIPANGPTTPTLATSFGNGTDAELGVLYGYFMSHYPAGYSALVNPTGGVPPSATDWNNNITTAGALQNILDGLTRQIGIHQTGTTGGITAGYLTASNGVDIVPGHFSIKLNQAGSYTLDFSGTYKANGYNAQTLVKGISNELLTINLTVNDPKIEKIYLVGNGLAYDRDLSNASSHVYVFDNTAVAGVDYNTFRVYPVILDTRWYMANGETTQLPDYLSISDMGQTGINYVLASDWQNGTIGTWASSDETKLSITPGVAAGWFYLEVTVLDDIDPSSPVFISLALAQSAAQTATPAIKYDVSASSLLNPSGMAIYTVTN